MRIAKRWASIVAALTMTATLITGCGVNMVDPNAIRENAGVTDEADGEDGTEVASKDGFIWGDGNGNPVELTVF